MVADINVDEWLAKSDPNYYIQQQEDQGTMFNRIRQSIKRLSSLYFNQWKQQPPPSPNEPATAEYVIHSGLPSPPLRPIISDDQSSYDETPKRPELDRRVSSSSSISGIGLTFGRFRGGFTPMN